MARITPVNSRITDAVTQSNISVLANAPAMAMGTIYQSSAHSIGILYANATAAQQQGAMCAQAATNMGVMQLYSGGSMGAVMATRRIAQQPAASGTNIATVLAILQLARTLR